MKVILWRIKLVFVLLHFNYASKMHLFRAFRWSSESCWIENYYAGESPFDAVIEDISYNN